MGNFKIVYYDLAIGAAVGAKVTAVGQSSFSDPAKLPFWNTQKPFTTLERNNWLLDDGVTLYNGEKVPYWSKELSDEEVALLPPNYPSSITFTLDNKYTSFGITLEFDSHLDNRCNAVQIIWGRKDGTEIANKLFDKIDSNIYFCENFVEGYETVTVKLLMTAIPHRYAKLNRVIFGLIRNFDRSEIRKAEIHTEADPISNAMTTSTVDWTLDSNEDVDYVFQKKQPIYTYDGNENLLNITYIDSSNRISKNVYEIHNEDVFGLLDKGTFPGKIFNGEFLKDEISALLFGRYDIYVSPELENEKLYGYITKCSRREALRQMCFSVGACATTFRTNGIRVYRAEKASPKAILPPDEVFTGQELEIKNKVTSVSVTAHTLVPDGNGPIEIGGQKYKDELTVKSKTSPEVNSYDIANVVEVTNMTLVTLSNIDKVLDSVYNYAVQRNKMSATLILNDHDLGENVSIPTNWGTQVNGQITKMTVKLSSLTVADIETRGE